MSRLFSYTGWTWGQTFDRLLIGAAVLVLLLLVIL